MSSLRHLFVHSRTPYRPYKHVPTIAFTRYLSTNKPQPPPVRGTKSIVVALGGNAIKKPNDEGTASEMFANVNHAVSNILNIAKCDSSTHYNLCITHGNGPQIGSLFLQNQLCASDIPALPLTFCGAMTQGYIGYMLQQSFTNHLNSTRDNPLHAEYKGAVTLVNQVGISMHDEAFQSPSKPIGKFYSETEAQQLAKENGYHMMEDSGRGWRMSVGSPTPLRIMEIGAIKRLLSDGYIVIATGGGGIPVVIDGQETDIVYGKDAVIDKDLTSVLLAKKLWADCLIIATDGDGIWLDYGKPNAHKLDKIEVSELKAYYQDGKWNKYKGSMAPKIKAVLQFVEETGRDAIICDLKDIDKALLGEAGSMVYHKDKAQFEEGFKYFAQQ